MRSSYVAHIGAEPKTPECSTFPTVKTKSHIALIMFFSYLVQSHIMCTKAYVKGLNYSTFYQLTVAEHACTACFL